MVIDAAFPEKMAGRTRRSQVAVCVLYDSLYTIDHIPAEYKDVVMHWIGCSPL